MNSKITPLLLTLLLLNFVLLSCGSGDVNIYVSPNGNDAAKANLSNPIASLQYAAELARESAGKAPVTIYLSGGVYRLKEPLKLEHNDGGTLEFPVRWKAMPGEKPVISGGVSVKNWKQESNGLWSAKLPTDLDANFRSFYINDKRATRARFPDKDFLKVAKTGEDNRTNFFFEKDQIPELENIEGLRWFLSMAGR